MLLRIESVKGSFAGKFQAVYDWLIEHQPSFATVTVPSRNGEFIVNLKPELSIEEGWLYLWIDLIEIVLEEKDFREDNEMVLTSRKIFDQMPVTLSESYMDPENVEELIRWAGHDVFRGETI